MVHHNHHTDVKVNKCFVGILMNGDNLGREETRCFTVKVAICSTMTMQQVRLLSIDEANLSMEGA